MDHLSDRETSDVLRLLPQPAGDIWSQGAPPD